MDILKAFYKSLKNSTDVKQSALQLLSIFPYNFTYDKSTNAFIMYICSYIYVSQENQYIYTITSIVAKIFIRLNENKYSEILNQYLNALSVYCFDIVWTWYKYNKVDKQIFYAISTVISNMNFSANNLDKVINIDNYYDNIVIGNGTSAGVYVNDFDVKETVLVIDQGQYITYDPVVSKGKSSELYNIFPLLPAEIHKNIKKFLNELNISSESPKYKQSYNLYSTDGTIRRIYGGSAVGGASTHNYMQTVMYSKTFFDKTEIIGGSNWSCDKMYKRFRSITTYDSNFIDNKIHITQEEESPFLTTLLELIKNHPPSSDEDIEMTFDYNNGYNNVLAITSQMYTYKNFIRCSVSAAFTPLTKLCFIGYTQNNSGIWMNIEKPNIIYLTNTFVTKINIESNIATSVVTSNGIVKANRIICSAGAVGSCQVIQNSGIGNPEVLERANTQILITNTNVGKFYNHYGPFIQFHLHNPISTENEPKGTTWSMAFLKMLPQYISRSIQCIFQLSVEPDDNEITDFQILCFIVQPNQHGCINITRSNGEPMIIYNFYENENDLHLARSIIEYFNDLFSDIATMTYPSQDVVNDTDKLKQYLLTYNNISPGTIIADHMCGTLALGKVVDKNFRVMGMKNLYVVDNSVWPIIPDGNTEAAALIVGKMFGEYLKKCN